MNILKKAIKLAEAQTEVTYLKLHSAIVTLNKCDIWLGVRRNMHSGERCFILGNGPSLNKCDLRLLKSEVTFGVNGIFMFPNFTPTYYVTISSFFWRDHVERIQHVQCAHRFLAADMRELASDVPTSWLNYRRPKRNSRFGIPLPVPLKFSHRPDKVVYGGGTVLFVCMQLAYYMGIDKVILLGVDHDYGKLGRAFHSGYSLNASDIVGRHFTKQYYSPNTRVHIDILAMERAYTLAKETFERAGRKILNATAGSKLDIYPKTEYLSLF